MECSEANVKKIKTCLSNMIEKEESILEFATVKLSVCSPLTEKFRSFIKEGILCVIINRNTSCLFLKLFELIEFNKVFEIELYTNINDGYTVRDNYFHIIEFPGFFLGLSFPVIDNQNVANRSSLIQKSIISTSKFISINLSDYIYSHKFDFDKSSSKKIAKTKTYNKKGSIIFRPQNVNINYNKEEKEKDKSKIKPSKKDDSGNLEMLSNKVKFSANLDGQIDLKENNIKNNNEFDSLKKSKSSFINYSNNNKKDSDSGSSKSNSSDESHSITVTTKNNAFENSNYYQERESFYTSSKDRQKGILKKSTSSNLDNKLEHQHNNKIEPEKPQIIIESREKMLYDSISIGDSADKKIYKICQYHILKDKMKLIKKLFKKNFLRFMNSDKISFEKIREYKINTYDFINDDDYSSEEDDGKKTFVDYVPTNDMIGFLENQDIQDERELELMQQKKNLKEISKKKEDGIPMRTTAI